jgi:hypothetical protein
MACSVQGRVPLVKVELVYVVYDVELAVHVSHHLPGGCVAVQLDSGTYITVLGSRIRRIRMLIGLPDPDLLVRVADPDPFLFS